MLANICSGLIFFAIAVFPKVIAGPVVWQEAVYRGLTGIGINVSMYCWVLTGPVS
jgi:hypothetical protein